MSKPAASVCVKPAPGAAPAAAPAPADVLLRTFNEMRDELVSTLWFLLGNQEDALDVAQEVFLRCWRARERLAGVENVKAWVFRVGLNAARDVQRSAWRRRVKALHGAEIANDRLRHWLGQGAPVATKAGEVQLV